ncbi:hypothetical protein Agub_g6029, partial [Astrephomene gubernaculifera]
MDYDALQRRRDAAARRIQAAWRAYKGRKAFLRLRDAAGRIQAAAKGWYVRKQVQEQRGRQELDQRFNAVMERHREKIRVLELEKRALQALPGAEMAEREAVRVAAAVRVQAAWRGCLARRRMAQSPERARREQAARRIQSAFKQALLARRSTAALSIAIPNSSSSVTAIAAAAALQQQQLLRASGASVLLGSPQTSVVGGGRSRSPSPSPNHLRGSSYADMPQQKQQQGREQDTGAGVLAARNSSVIGPRRYKELKAQVEGKLSAYVALARHRGPGSRPRTDPRVTDARLAALLSAHAASSAGRTTEILERQRNLVAVDCLCVQLEQVRPLSELPPGAAPSDFPRPARGSERAERAAAAHALALAEARAGGRWWDHLKGLNTQAVQDALQAEDEEQWDALDARWRRSWKQLEEQENQRPDVVEELRAMRAGGGAAAVAAARREAAMQAKQDEYFTRSAAAA